MGMIRKKRRDISGGWQAHGDDVRQALQILSCGLVLRSKLLAVRSAERFIREGYAVRCAGYFALTGRGTLAALRSPAVWREALGLRRLARKSPATWDRLPRGWPLVPARAQLADAIGLRDGMADTTRAVVLGPVALPPIAARGGRIVVYDGSREALASGLGRSSRPAS